MANITELRQAIGAGGRVNKYRVNFSIPSAVPISSDLQNADLLCKSASFPGMTITAIDVMSQGRKLSIPGDTTYEGVWALTFYNTEGHELRRDLISWMRSADDFQKNMHSGNPGDVMGEMSVVQLDSAGNETAVYTFHNIWCSEVGAIELADEADGGIAEVTATFTFSDWVVGTGEESDPTSGAVGTGNSIS